MPSVISDLEEQTQSIIAASIRNNRSVGVTGLLLTYQGWFVQALEGSAKAVMTTYGRIVDDPRHGDTRVLASGPAETRAFASWNMCARHLGPADAAVIEVMDAGAKFDPERLTGASALRLLQTVAGVQARTALAALA